jgi:uncharacterized protein (TIGR03437 family)
MLAHRGASYTASGDAYGVLSCVVGAALPFRAMKRSVWILFLATLAQAQTSYLTYPAGVAPNGIAAADLNGDGKPDLVVANSVSNSLTILLNNGTGGFTALDSLVFGQFGFAFASLTPGVLLAADLNGDHKTDLIVSSLTGIAIGNSAPVGLVALLGNGDGTFQAPIPISGCLQVTSVQAADVNGDGVPDLEATCLNGGGIVPVFAYLLVLPGNGDGTFGSGASYSLELTPWAAFTVGDFNRDRYPDIAVATGQTLTVFLNDGKADFMAVSTPGEPWNFTPGIAAGDFNGDGVLDLAVAGQSGAFAANGLVAVLLGNGDGTFQAGPMLSTTAPGVIAAVDLNGDGHLDLAEGLPSVTFFAGRGDGTFEGGFPISGSGNNGLFALADFTSSGVFGVAAIDNAVTADGIETTGSVAILPRVVWPTLALANVSAAGFGLGPMAPGSIASAFGENLASETAQAAGTPSATLGGVSVAVTDSAGVSRAAALYYVSPSQVNYVIPAGTAAGLATVSIASGGEASGTGQIEIALEAPRLFVVNAANLAAANVLLVSQSGTRTFENIYQTDSSGNITALPIELGSATDTVFLTLYGTGIGQRSPNEVTVSIGDSAGAMVTYAGPQGVQVGVDQINVELSNSLASPSPRTVTIDVTVDGQPSNQVTLLIQ